jgi:hypothetical protein
MTTLEAREKCLRNHSENGPFRAVKAAQKVHQWPQGKYISLMVGGNGGLASGRGSARGISASPLH